MTDAAELRIGEALLQDILRSIALPALQAELKDSMASVTDLKICLRGSEVALTVENEVHWVARMLLPKDVTVVITEFRIQEVNGEQELHANVKERANLTWVLRGLLEWMKPGANTDFHSAVRGLLDGGPLELRLSRLLEHSLDEPVRSLVRAHRIQDFDVDDGLAVIRLART